jgi:hypothetical protein
MTAQVSLSINQGRDFATAFQLLDQNQLIINVTGCAARLQFRRTALSAIVLLEASSANGKLVVGGTDGVLRLYLAPSDTQLLTCNCVYDLKLTSPGNSETITAFEGMARINPAITR